MHARYVPVRIGRALTTLSTKYDLHSYVCASLTQHTWLPSNPGKHGFLLHDLGLNSDRTPSKGDNHGSDPPHGETAGPVTQIHRDVFVGTGTGVPEVFHYCGLYRIVRTDDLTREEWEALPSEVSRLPLEGCYYG